MKGLLIFSFTILSYMAFAQCDSTDIEPPAQYSFQKSFGGLDFPFVYQEDLYLRLDPLGNYNTELYRYLGEGEVELVDDLISEDQGIFPLSPLLIEDKIYLIGFAQGGSGIYILNSDSLSRIPPWISGLNIFTDLFFFEDALYFSAFSEDIGAELFKLDNNDQIELVIDFNPGSASSYLAPRAAINSRLFLNSFTDDFSFRGHYLEDGQIYSLPILDDKRIVAAFDDKLIVAYDDDSGIGEEPYLFDGESFHLMADLNEGPNSSSFSLDTRPMTSYNTPLRDELLFSARTANYSVEFFIYDGDSLKNVFPYEVSSPIYDKSPNFWVELGTDLFYSFQNGSTNFLYKEPCFFPEFIPEPIQPVDPIPTMSQWSVIILTIIFLIIGCQARVSYLLATE